MNPLFLYACVFSLLAAIAIALSARRLSVDSHRITRFALLILLVLPVLLFLPKIYCLPSSRSYFFVTETANQSTPLWLSVLWLSGMALCIVKLMLSLWQLRAWRKNSHLLQDEAIAQTLKTCCDQQQFHRSVELRVHHERTSPVACGTLRPMIYLPSDWKDWSPTTLRAVLLHEIGHHRSFDPFWRLLSLVCTSLHWYNPLVSWLSRQLQLQSEVACDATVIHSGFRKDHYANILCDLACHAPYSAMAMASPSGLELRVRQLKEQTQPRQRWWLYGLMIVLLTSGVAVAMLRPARDPGTPLAPTPVDSEFRLKANPFPED